MAKLRKMLGAADSPYILSLMSLIETQSKTTIGDWCVDYAENISSIFMKRPFRRMTVCGWQWRHTAVTVKGN